MNLARRFLLVAEMLVFTAAAILAPSAHAAGGTPDAKISGTYLTAAGAVRILRIELNIAKVNPDGCTGTFGTTAEFPSGQALLIRELDDSKASAQFLSMVQLAYATDARVAFWLVGCTSVAANYWGGTWPMPVDIYVRK